MIDRREFIVLSAAAASFLFSKAWANPGSWPAPGPGRKYGSGTPTPTPTATPTPTPTPGPGISDDFTTDTSANYTELYNDILISGGVARGTGVWDESLVYHSTSLGSANQIVSGLVTYNGASDCAAIMGRVSASGTGYETHFVGGDLVLRSFSSEGYAIIGVYEGAYEAGTYTLSMSLNGTTITVSVNGTERISTTDATYSAGNYCGMAFFRGVDNFDATVDNFSGAPQ